MNNKKNYYEILGIDKNATEVEIKKAYRKQATKMHPDVGGDPKSFMELKKAYDVLRNPTTKKEYDAKNMYSSDNRSDFFNTYANKKNNAPSKDNNKKAYNKAPSQKESNFYSQSVKNKEFNFKNNNPKSNTGNNHSTFDKYFKETNSEFYEREFYDEEDEEEYNNHSSFKKLIIYILIVSVFIYIGYSFYSYTKPVKVEKEESAITKLIPSSDKTFKINSTEKKVKEAMGEPDSIYKNVWTYGESKVYFNDEGKVIEYTNAGNLSVK